MKLYISDSEFKEIELKDESYRLRSISGEHNVTLLFDLPEFYEFPLGTFCEFQGERYTLLKPQNFRKINTYHYEYTLVMESSQGVLNGVRFKELVSKKVKFTITAKPEEYLRLLVDNLNSAQGGNDWQVGNCLQSAEKLIAFNHQSCMEALQVISQAFNTEWEISGKTIHLKKVEYNKEKPLALKLSYGKGNGIKPNINRNSENHRITRLYVQGGDRNIDAFKYGNDALLLPKNYTATYEGKEYRTDTNGLYLERTEQANYVNEASLDLTHIYPKRVGAVTSVIEKDTSKNLFDFSDNTIPTNLDYNAHTMNGQKLSVIFESGMLSGREFDVIYRHSERLFEIFPKEEDGRMMPDAIFKPAIGDKYAVFGMMLPDAYISDPATKSGASFEMLNEALKYFHENEQDKFSFSFEMDAIWAKKNWVNIGGKIVLGGYVNFSDWQFMPDETLIRIVSIKDYINNPESPIVELSNEVVFGKVTSLFGKIKENEVVIEKKTKEVKDFAKRRFRDMEETEKLIQKAFTNFGKSINPATIRTMQLMVGDASLQFRFVVSKTQLTEIPIAVNYNSTIKQLHISGGTLQHLTLGIDSIKPNRNANEYKFWNVAPFISGVLNDPKPYFLYIKASKANEMASFILLDEVVELEAVAGYYHFLVGILNSESENDRGFAKVYGVTEILPGQITTRKIASANGQNYIELGDDEINIVAKVKFTDNSPAINQLKTAVSPDLLGLESRLKQFSEQKITESNQESQQAINEAKTATEAYARQQSELVKTLAIAHADGKVSEAEQRQITNATQKLQEAKTYAEQKVNALQVGFKNLILKSKEKRTLNRYMGLYWDFSEPMEVGKEYVFSCFSEGNTPLWCYFTDIQGQPRQTIKWLSNGYNEVVINPHYAWTGICVFQEVGAGGSGVAHIEKIQLKRGNKTIDYSPAPEDIESDVRTAKAWADMFNQAEKDNVKKISEIFQKRDDFISGTYAVKNTITTGAMMVGNHLGGNAGINGSGFSATDVRFWAGSNFANRANAPYRVLDNGDVYTSKLHALNGCHIGSFEITENGLSYRVHPRSEQGVKMFYDSLNFYGSSGKTFHRMGTQVFSSSSGTTCFSFIQNKDDGGVGSIISLGKEINQLPYAPRGLGQYINCPNGTALYLDSERGTALEIKKGIVRVDGRNGIDTVVRLGNTTLTFRKGILVEHTY